MSIKSDKAEIEDIKHQVEEIQEESLALELIKDYKKQTKRLFIIWIITFIAFIGTVGYLIHTLNDKGVETTTTETYDMNTENGNNNFIGGNNNGNIENK